MRVRVKVRVKATVKGEKVPTCCVVGLTIVGLAIVSTAIVCRVCPPTAP